MAYQKGATLGASAKETSPRVNEFKRFLKVFTSRGLVVFGLVIILVFLITAAFANLIAPFDPNAMDLEARLLNPSLDHLLGTDNMGRDTLSRLIYGSRISLLVGVVVVAIAASVGMTLGLIAGYFGKLIYIVIMRSIDAIMSIPMVLLALAIASLLGGGLTNVIIALTVGIMPTYARLMCGQVLIVKEHEYITSEHAIGSNHLRIMLRHIIPNCLPPLIVLITMVMGTTILAEAGLSFLGIGIIPPTPAWGSMVTDGREYLLSNPILSFAPGVAIMLVVFAFNMVGDGLRDTLDPRLRGVL